MTATPLTASTKPTATTDQPRRRRRLAVHGGRVLLLVVIIALLHTQSRRRAAGQAQRPFAHVDVNQLRTFFPQAASLGDEVVANGGREVFDTAGVSLGYVVQTSPAGDRFIGFSGPTNVLIAFDTGDRILGTGILTSGDTRDHVAQVRGDENFLRSLSGLTWEEAARTRQVDGVSGATLTSMAIEAAIIHRLGGGRPSLRFPDPLTADEARQLFATAADVQQDAAHAPLWHVHDTRGHELGTILRTSPQADDVVGYQGPTDTIIGFSADGRIIGIALRSSYDNEPYVTYVREDAYFLSIFNRLVLQELAELDLEDAEVEGVSGATMTSMAVAAGVLLAAAEQERSRSNQAVTPTLSWTRHDLGTGVVVLVGLCIGLTSLRSGRRLRLVFQLILIVYLGLINGDMLSQAMLVGWAQHGVPWRGAGGLLLLTIAAFLVPLTSRKNIYCARLCPHGAAQQLLRNRLPWRVRLPRRASRTLAAIPALLLAWCLLVAMMPLPFSLVDIEPFDTWVFRVAGWATITVAVVGLLASLLVPMAYCRYGCPTGALLGYLRFNSHSDRWTPRDWTVVALVALSFLLWLK